MQERVVELIPGLCEEELIGELLVMNDDLNNAFIRYERYCCQIDTTVTRSNVRATLKVNFVLLAVVALARS